MEKFNEVSPPKWSGTVKAMKKHKEIDNPYALSWYMKNKGDKPHYKEMPNKSSKDPGEPEKKEKYKDEDKPKHKKKHEHIVYSFSEWKSRREQLVENAELTPITDLGISSRGDYGDLSQWDGTKENFVKNRWLESCKKIVSDNNLQEDLINWNELSQSYTQGATPEQALNKMLEACCPACAKGDFAHCTCKNKSRKK